MTHVLTPRQKAALEDYWAAKTPKDESAAMARMQILGLFDPPEGLFDQQEQPMNMALLSTFKETNNA